MGHVIFGKNARVINVTSFLSLEHTIEDNLRALETYIQERGKGWATLRAQKRFLHEQYKLYSKNVFEPIGLRLPRSKYPHAGILYGLYDSRKNCFSYISRIREAAKNLGCCPYCGLPGSITLDHYLPRFRTGFPQFSALSLNLVPACMECQLAKSSYFSNRMLSKRPKCRINQRASNYKRVLHPYFDKFLKNPVLGVRFSVIGAQLLDTDLLARAVCKPQDRSLLEYHLRKMKVNRRAQSFFDHYRRAIIEEIKGLNPINVNTAMSHLPVLISAARERGGKAENYLEVAYLRSLLSDVQAVQLLVTEALAGTPALQQTNAAIVHF